MNFKNFSFSGKSRGKLAGVNEFDNLQGYFAGVKISPTQATKGGEGLFHGSPNAEQIKKTGFSMDKLGSNSGYKGTYGEGIYLTSIKDRASLYGDVVETNIGKLNLYEPKNIINDLFARRETNYGEPAKITSYLKSLGYDGVRVGDEVVVFDPKKVKVTSPTQATKGVDPLSATPEQQLNLIRNAKPGTGEFKVGDVYTQEVASGKRPVLISKVNPDGSVEGFYTGAISPTERSFGITPDLLLPAKWNNPKQELQTPTQATKGGGI